MNSSEEHNSEDIILPTSKNGVIVIVPKNKRNPYSGIMLCPEEKEEVYSREMIKSLTELTAAEAYEKMLEPGHVLHKNFLRLEPERRSTQIDAITTYFMWHRVGRYGEAIAEFCYYDKQYHEYRTKKLGLFIHVFAYLLVFYFYKILFNLKQRP